ncbi:histonelysine Nmethyltransferase SETMARlike [Trichonephila clavipes]|nr:histonelysine Nmethyltransferase SETMARlike [Trichonephila clavipes]
MAVLFNLDVHQSMPSMTVEHAPSHHTPTRHLHSSSIFHIKYAPRTGRPVVENVDEATEIIEIDRHVSSRSIAQHLKIDHRTVLNHLLKVGLKKKLDVWVRHQLTPKT